MILPPLRRASDNTPHGTVFQITNGFALVRCVRRVSSFMSAEHRGKEYEQKLPPHQKNIFQFGRFPLQPDKRDKVVLWHAHLLRPTNHTTPYSFTAKLLLSLGMSSQLVFPLPRSWHCRLSPLCSTYDRAHMRALPPLYWYLSDCVPGGLVQLCRL